MEFRERRECENTKMLWLIYFVRGEREERFSDSLLKVLEVIIGIGTGEDERSGRGRWSVGMIIVIITIRLFIICNEEKEILSVKEEN